jgi:hypothetical protein
MLVWKPLRKRPLLTQNTMDMAVLVNTLRKNEVDFTTSNHVTQRQNFSTQVGYKTKNKNYYKLI